MMPSASATTPSPPLLPEMGPLFASAGSGMKAHTSPGREG